MARQNNDREYFARREAAERKLAETATDETIARVHRRFAAAYAERVRQLGGEPVPWGYGEPDV